MRSDPQRRLRRPRSRRTPGPIAVLLTLGLIATACHTTIPHKGRVAPHVLGQETGTPDVVGRPAPAGTGELDAVSCGDATHCWAVGTTTPANGTTTSTTAAATPGAQGATVIDATGDGGKTWAAEPLALSPAPALTGVSCPGPRLCMAVGLNGSGLGGIVLITRDAGATWTVAATPTGAVVVTSVDCADTADCTVIASDGTTFWSAHSADFGTTWTRQGALPTGLQDAGALSCTMEDTCLATGFTATTAGHGQGAVAVSTDGGMTWAAADVPAGTGLLQGALCTTATSCLAVGTTSSTVSAVIPAKGALLSSDDGGQSWLAAGAHQPVDDMYAIACPTPLTCAVVGTDWTGTPPVGEGAVARSTDGGLRFTTATSEYTPLALTAVACPTSRVCVAVGGDTVARVRFARPVPARRVIPSVTPSAGTKRPRPAVR